jgi:hypothetical protein
VYGVYMNSETEIMSEPKWQSHADWRSEHPTEHPLWCRVAVTGGLETCDCDLAYPEVMEPKGGIEE